MRYLIIIVTEFRNITLVFLGVVCASRRKLHGIHRRDLNPTRIGEEERIQFATGEGCLLISLQVHTCVTNQRYPRVARGVHNLYSLSGKGTRREEVARPEKFDGMGAFHKSFRSSSFFLANTAVVLLVREFRIANASREISCRSSQDFISSITLSRFYLKYCIMF